jgi:hypothetical protein
MMNETVAALQQRLAQSYDRTRWRRLITQKFALSFAGIHD